MLLTLSPPKLPTPPTFHTLDEVLQYRAKGQPHQLAYRFYKGRHTEAITITYQALDQQAQWIAATLQCCNIPSGSRILLLYSPGIDFIAAFFGCLYAGMVAVPVHVPMKENHVSTLRAIATNAQPSLFLTTEALLPHLQGLFEKSGEFYPPQSPFIKGESSGLPPLQGRVRAGSSTASIFLRGSTQLSKLEGIATDALPPMDYSRSRVKDSHQLAFLQYTSGSTGSPKGVMVSHGNILHNSATIYQAFGHGAKSEGVIWLPPFHDMGLIGGIIQPLYGGFPVTLIPPEKVMMRPFLWLKTISENQATTSGGPNFAYDWCVQRISQDQLKQLDLSCWQVAFTGAEPVRPKTLEKFAETFAPCGFKKEAFYPCYGMAETTLFVTGGLKHQAPVIESVDAQALEQGNVIPSSSSPTRDVVGCGYVWSNQTVMIVDPDLLTPCTDAQVGEIWVVGDSVTQGYWQNSKANERTFNAYLANSEEGPFLRTGDLGFFLDGELFVTGRVKDVMIIRGRNIYPHDIELTAQSSHTTLQPEGCAAIAIDNGTEEKLVVLAEVKRRAVKDLNTTEVIEKIRGAIAQHHELTVHDVVLLKSGSLPKTTSGKIRRHACREQFLNQNLRPNI